MSDPRQGEQRRERVEEQLGSPVGLRSGSVNSVFATELGEVALELEEFGYPALWFGETFGREAFVNAALLLCATRSLRAGTGIANIYVRDATAAKGAANALAEAYPGRFVLGLGVSHRPLLEARGQSQGSPLADMRNFLDALDEAPYSGPASATPPPRLLAALGPRMHDLARDRSD